MYAYAWYEQCTRIYESEAESFQTLLCSQSFKGEEPTSRVLLFDGA